MTEKIEPTTIRINLNTGQSQKVVSRISIIDELVRLMDIKCLEILDRFEDVELMHGGEIVYVMKNVPTGVVYGMLFLHGLVK
jgi:hypothetical protein